MKISINLREFIFALSDALDFVGVDDIFHGKRVGYMASLCASEIGYSVDQISDIIEMGLLHDCGVSNTGTHERLVTEFHWKDSEVHCIRGEELLNESTLLKKYATVIRYHHTKWEDLQSIHISQEHKNLANLIFLTDRVDALNAKYSYQDINEKIKTIQNEIKDKTDFFSPMLIEAFLRVSKSQAFWYGLESLSITEFLEEWKDVDEIREYSFCDIEELVRIFAYIVDFKSPFTAEHSLGVALVAKELAKEFGFSQNIINKIELAGFLHDLGKLRIPDSILDKPTKLNANELSIMNKHSFDTYFILRKIKGFEDIAKWAGLHHEKLDGNGYPYGLDKPQIPDEAKVIAIADIFQALVQKRPYRDTLSKERVVEIMDSMENENKIDKKIYSFIKNKLEFYYDLALNPQNYKG
jgi:HD-GYP domain-containing protein (c-di-GMP phosphodiesterase class II)